MGELMTEGEQTTEKQQQGQPQMVPKRMAELRDLRNLNWRLDMEYTSENSTLRMLELDLLLQIAQAGVPVDPEVLTERATNSRSVRERLKSYLDKAQQAQAEGAKAERQALEAQSGGMLQIDAMKAQETARHNKVMEQLQALEQKSDERLKLMELGSESHEKDRDRQLAVVKMGADHKKEGMKQRGSK